MADTSAISDMLLVLGYTPQWLACGMLTPDFLAAQYQQLTTGEDKHTEHYRYGAFRHYLAGRTYLTDEELAAYLSLALAERDTLMGGAAAKDLFAEVSLTDSQFAETCARLDEFPGDWTTGLLDRQRLLRKLSADPLDEALFTECLRGGDSVVQKMLLQLASAGQLIELAAKAKTRSIRNAAAAKAKAG